MILWLSSRRRVMCTCSSNSNHDHHHHNHHDHEQAAGKQRAPSLPLLGLPERAQSASGHSSWLSCLHYCQQVPEEYEKPFLHINNTARRTFSGMVMAMDEAVRTCFANNRICTSNIVQFFLVHLILDLMLSFYNSIFVFSQNIIKPWKTEYESRRKTHRTTDKKTRGHKR